MKLLCTTATQRRCLYALADWAQRRLICRSKKESVIEIVTKAVVERTLTPDLGAALVEPKIGECGNFYDGYFVLLPMPLANAFDAVAKAHGLSRKQALSFTLKWAALHMPDTEQHTVDDDNEGEEWKGAAS